MAGIPLRGHFGPRVKVTLSDPLQTEPGRRLPRILPPSKQSSPVYLQYLQRSPNRLETRKALPHKALRPIQAFISKSPTRFALSGQASIACIDREARRGAALRDLRCVANAFLRGGVRDAPRSGIVAPAASVGAGGKRGTLRLGQRRGGSHPRVFPTPGTPKGGHIHTDMQGTDSAVPTLKNRWEVRSKGVIRVAARVYLAATIGMIFAPPCLSR